MPTATPLAIVTGGHQGIGQAVCDRLATEGFDVAVIDLQSAEATMDMVRSRGRRVAAYVADVSNAEQVQAALEAVDADFGRVDVLVNVAGVAYFEPFLEASEVAWDRTVAINLKGVFLVSQAAARFMRARTYGRIVSIVSNAAILGYPSLSGYIASKAGVAALTMAMAAELGPFNITVNGVSPGTVKAGQTSAEYLAGGREEAEIAVTPMRRLGTPGDIGALIAFLVSDEAGWITGQTITIDGGYSIVPA